MKRLTPVLAILFLFALLVSPSTQASAAQVTYYPAELEYIDAQINVMAPYLEAFQAEYFAVNGRYYQALTSHAAAPDVPTLPDGIESSPTDQEETLAFFWSDAALPDQLGWSFSVDTYSSPDGDGYVLTVETVSDGNVWMRAINHGPASEAWRTSDWYQVAELRS